MNLPKTWKTKAVLAALILTFAIGSKDVEKLGDRFQVALPVIALGCSAVNGQFGDFLLRYVIQLGVVHGSKHALGDAPVNIRPNGGGLGMPSGHTATAALGASNLVHECLAGSPWVQGAVILTAGFVGGSRIEAGKHDIWQVLAGALAGWVIDRGFRKTSPRGALARLFHRVAGWFGRGAT